MSGFIPPIKEGLILESICGFFAVLRQMFCHYVTGEMREREKERERERERDGERVEFSCHQGMLLILQS